MNNRFCRCCFSAHNADDMRCWGFLRHLSDNKHSLGSRRLAERPLAGQSMVSAGEELSREQLPPRGRWGHRDCPLPPGKASWLGWTQPEMGQALLGGPVGSSSQESSLAGNMPAPGSGRGLAPKMEKPPKDIRLPPCRLYHQPHREDGKGQRVFTGPA